MIYTDLLLAYCVLAHLYENFYNSPINSSLKSKITYIFTYLVSEILDLVSSKDFGMT